MHGSPLYRTLILVLPGPVYRKSAEVCGKTCRNGGVCGTRVAISPPTGMPRANSSGSTSPRGSLPHEILAHQAQQHRIRRERVAIGPVAAVQQTILTEQAPEL